MNHNKLRGLPFLASFFAANLSGLAGVLPASDACAQDRTSGPYLGVGWGKFSQQSDLPLASSENNSATKVFAGYELFKFFAIEGGLGNFNGQTFDLGGGSVSRVDNDSFYARANIQIPILHTTGTSVTLYAGGGVHRWEAKEVTMDAGGSVIGEGRGRDTETMYGAGVLLRGQGSSALRFDYEIFEDVGTANKIDLRLWSINLVAYF